MSCYNAVLKILVGEGVIFLNYIFWEYNRGILIFFEFERMLTAPNPEFHEAAMNCVYKLWRVWWTPETARAAQHLYGLAAVLGCGLLPRDLTLTREFIKLIKVTTARLSL